MTEPGPEERDTDATTSRAGFGERLAARQSHPLRVGRLAILEYHLGGPPAAEVLSQVSQCLYGDTPAPRAAG
ncbi:hypothetical protein [Saccharothrix deserti]|uniref:hypothetical protein n=1 Tax=Saccharothrix deserti TaxID=2593674 RepID=UPI00131B2522|nr:hypothetical protein [Saccharothrix deserti]